MSFALVLLIALWRAATAGAAEPPPPTLAPRTYPAETAAFDLAEEPRGVIWVAGQSGVRRYDGLGMRAWRASAPGAPQRQPHVIAAIADDEVWVGFGRGLLVRRAAAPFFEITERGGPGLWAIARSGWTRVPPPPGSGELDVTALASDRRGGAWVGTSAGLWHHAPDRWDRRIAEGLPSPHVLAVEVGDTELLVGTVAGAAIVGSDGHVRAIGPREPVAAVAWGAAGEAWLAGATGVTRVANDGGTARFAAGDGLPDAEVATLLPDGPGRAWVGTAGGLARIDGDRARAWTDAAMAGVNVTRLRRDREGELWVTLRDGGVVRLERRFVESFGRAEGLAGNVASAVLAARRPPALWIASERGLTRRADGRSTSFLAGRELPAGTPASLAEAPDGAVWAAYREGTLVRVSADGRGRAVGAVAAATALAFTPDGSLWVGRGNGGITRFTPRGEALGPPANEGPGPCAGAIVSLVPRRAGGVWVTTDGGGFGTLDAAGARCWTHEAGLPSDRVAALLEDADGTLWLGLLGDAGLARFRDGRFTRWTQRDGLYCDSIFGIVDDGAGHLWTACGGGAQRIDRAELDAAAPGRTVRVVAVLGEDGMRAQECSFGAQPVATFGPDGRLWLATIAGASGVSPAIADRRWPPLEVTIESATIDGERMALAGGSVDARTRGAAQLAIGYTAVRFTAATRVPLRFRLDPIDRDWRSDADDRVARWAAVPPGRYRLRVQAIPQRGLLPEAEATLSIVLRPPFQQTVWFRVAIGAAALAALLGVLRARAASTRRAEAAAKGERARIARDLHDSLGQGFTTVGLHLELLRQRLAGADAETRALVEQTTALVERCHDDAKGSIWALRREGDPGLVGAVQAELARAEPTAAAAGATLTFTVAESVATSAHAQRALLAHELPMLLREAITNAIRHGRARTIDVRLGVDGGALVLSVRDDGVGLPAVQPGAADGHFGLLSMQERARRTGGRLALLSPPGGGAEVRLTIAEVS